MHLAHRAPSYTTRVSGRRASNIRASTTDPGYITLFIEHVCNHPAAEFLSDKAADIATARRCIAGMYVPPIEKQQEIIDILRATAELIDIKDILGPSLSLLSQDKVEEYEALVNALIRYQASLEHVRGFMALVPSSRHYINYLQLISKYVPPAL